MNQSQNHPELQYSTDGEGNRWIKIAPNSKMTLVAMDKTMFELLVSSRNNETLTYHRSRYNKLQNEKRNFDPQDIKDPFFVDGKKFFVFNEDVKANEENDQLFVSQALYNSRVYTLTRRKRAPNAKEVAKVNAVQPVVVNKPAGLSFTFPGMQQPFVESFVPMAVSPFVLPGQPATTPAEMIPSNQFVPAASIFNPAVVSGLEVTADSDEDY